MALAARTEQCRIKGFEVKSISLDNDANNSFGMSVKPCALGLQVRNLRPAGIAAQGGVRMGDIIMSIGGRDDIVTEADLFAFLRSLPAGHATEIIFAQPPSAPPQERRGGSLCDELIGMTSSNAEAEASAESAASIQPSNVHVHVPGKMGMETEDVQYAQMYPE